MENKETKAFQKTISRKDSCRQKVYRDIAVWGRTGNVNENRYVFIK